VTKFEGVSLVKKNLAVLSVLMIFTLSCSFLNNLVRPVPTATATMVPGPTITPMPSMTSTPANTATPTCKSTPDATDTMFPGARITWYDDFECAQLNYGWGIGNTNPTLTAVVSGSVVTVHADEVKDVFDGLSRTNQNTGDNSGILMLFRIQEGTSANLFINTGMWETSDYRRWGLDIGNTSFQKTLWEGWDGQGWKWLSENFPTKLLQPGKWYYLFIRLGDAGQVTMKVWDKDDPSRHADFQRNMGSTWAKRKWVSMFQVYKGTLEIDEYQEMIFEAGN
jgi:hypothetical protein